ncbi:hypothetical protein SDRG_11270 [Saprolegnia diclina VS20]|uniref:Uncharacterized protein n=1 Tax=Saprolegnia diclina (strain VS20) TaxID=1156394 RepID=T0QC14_SAPDV|nr:hypothetical protein SDRG_11270 [Saprolegnia diclina VS20]EQC31085.1 hypothetical protein SDRG_11270 [Saprolegnia diclina VS20]|eukprot:XP_008615524.1 hypothetical protein SDRG_11270 [Saprolegnia diclina VS20]
MKNSAATAVLLDSALLGVVASFQGGCVEDLLPYARDYAAAFALDMPLPSCASISNLDYMWARTLVTALGREVDRARTTTRLTRYCPHMWTVTSVNLAAARGYLDVLQALHAANHLQTSPDALNEAAANGHMDVVRFLHEHGQSGCTVRAMNGAAQYGHLDVVQFLDSHRSEGCTVTAMNAAAINGHYEIVEYLHMHRSEGCTTSAMDGAAKNGHLSLVTFLQTHREEGCTTDAMDGALLYHHVDVATYLHAHRDEGCTPHALYAAAYEGDLVNLRFLCETRLEPFRQDVLDAAVAQGHVAAVSYLHAVWRVDAVTAMTNSVTAHAQEWRRRLTKA